MNIKELKETIKDLPDEVEVYRCADHGQMPEQNPGVGFTDYTDLSYYLEDIDWLDEGVLANDRITAMVLG